MSPSQQPQAVRTEIQGVRNEIEGVHTRIAESEEAAHAERAPGTRRVPHQDRANQIEPGRSAKQDLHDQPVDEGLVITLVIGLVASNSSEDDPGVGHHPSPAHSIRFVGVRHHGHVVARDRCQLQTKASDVLGRKECTTLMELLPPVIWADVAANATSTSSTGLRNGSTNDSTASSGSSRRRRDRPRCCRVQ